MSYIQANDTITRYFITKNGQASKPAQNDSLAKYLTAWHPNYRNERETKNIMYWRPLTAKNGRQGHANKAEGGFCVAVDSTRPRTVTMIIVIRHLWCVVVSSKGLDRHR